jgi:hypothetical protein
MLWFIAICFTILIDGQPSCREVLRLECANEQQCIRSLEALRLPPEATAYYYAQARPAPEAAAPPKAAGE